MTAITDDPHRWSASKIQHSTKHLEDYKFAIESWSEIAFVSPRWEISDDGLSATLFPNFGIPPETVKWSLHIGDYLHALRSSLDALAWELANQFLSPPVNPTKIYFPLFTDQREWEKAVSEGKLGCFAPDAIARIARVQPFQLQKPKASNVFLLHQMDIQDKHRELLDTGFEVQQVLFTGANGLRVDYRGHPPHPSEPEIEYHTDIIDDPTVPALTLHFDYPVLRVSSDLLMNFRKQLRFRDFRLEADDFLTKIFAEVSYIHQVVRGMKEPFILREVQLDSRVRVNQNPPTID